MDVVETSSKGEVHEVPPVPIKTYKWEDVRRARRQGGYPWTYLDKEPFDDEREHIEMESIQKSRSSNDIEGTRSEVVIEDISEKDATTTQESEQENQEEKMETNEADDTLKAETTVESADSSADISISQYLDKDDKDKDITSQSETVSSEEILDAPAPSTSKESGDLTRDKRAKSEEPGRKRKHSIESSYSRVSKYSLSKAGIMKRLREAKDKIKLPKFSFSKSDTKLNKKVKTEEKIAKELPKPETKIKPAKIEGPLYIHIPLKPPPGETDEFSHLEFEEPADSTKRGPSPIKEETKEEAAQEIPETPIEEAPVNAKGVQLIILSPPSDDEILDDLSPSIPETPSESGNKFFDNNRMDELKSIAKDVVDKYSPETKRKNLKGKDEVVIEEDEDLENKPKTDADLKQEITQTDAKEEKTTDNVKTKLQEDVKEKTLEEIKLKTSEDTKTESGAKSDEKDKPEETKKVIKKKIKKVKKEKSTDVKPKDEDKIIKSQKTDDDKIEEQQNNDDHKNDKLQKNDNKPEEHMFKVTTKEEIKMTVDEEDGLKTETVIAQIIAEEVKESDEKELKSSIKVEGSPLLKKKVSFKRRSKEDNDGIYEDVDVKKSEAEKEKEIDLTKSMSVDEEKSYLDDKIIKATSLEEDYKQWSTVNDHEYEPVNPPAEDVVIPQKKASTPVTDSDIEFLAAKAADIELRTTGIITVQEPKSKGGDAIFVPLASALQRTQSVKSEMKDDKKEPSEGAGKKFSDAIQKQATSLRRQASIISEKASSQAGKLHTRVKSIKKPKINMPNRPKMQRPSLPKLKIEKPKMPKMPNMPKMPAMPKMPKMPEKMKNMSMPTFSLPKKGATKRSTQRRQFSTESTVGGSKKKIFDFSTYPRIFSKKKKDGDDEIHTPRTGTDITPTSERSTLPHRFKFASRWKGKFTEAKPTAVQAVVAENSLMSKDSERSDAQGSVRIPLHSEDSMDRESLDLRSKEEREDSLERRMASVRYDNDIDMDDAYMKENQEIHRASSLNAKYNDRWNHGTFHENVPPNYEEQENIEPIITSDADREQSSNLRKKVENIRSESSDDIHRRGVLEEINDDEFFLRQKGISQDNIEVGQYLSSEIREAFRTPNNALTQMQSESFEKENLEYPMPEAPKRKLIKKPKRKKTPHVSQEVLPYDRESLTEPEEYPKYNNVSQPERPKRKSKSKHDADDIDDSQMDDYLQREMSDENILSSNKSYYENEGMEGIEQPGIVVSDPYQEAFFHASVGDNPSAPPRKQKSLRSLNVSEHDSISGEFNGYKEISQQHIDNYRMEHEYQIPTPEGPPKRPTRTRSRTRSHSRTATHPDDDFVLKRAESFASSQQSLSCMEEPCTKIVSDYMGYTVIDKSNKRDLPPSAPRRRRSVKSNKSGSGEKFFTVPRKGQTDKPVRPLRNYSTLGPSRPPRKRSVPNLTDEDKENVNSQYIEIEDDYHKNLQSGDIIKRMKDRPLPAPPRPPRKSRDSSRGSSRGPLRDISQDRSYLSSSQDFEKLDFEETEVSVQTEPLPDDFVCEELVLDIDDRVITPSVNKREHRPITEFEHQETITHGTLLVQPFTDDKYVNDSPIQTYSKSTERIITVKREVQDDTKHKDDTYYDDETSEIPEDFKKLIDPVHEHEQPIHVIESIIDPVLHSHDQPIHIIERIIERPVPMQFDSQTEVELVKAHKLQVTDLDVDRLAVNELHANKIKVGEIDSSCIQTSQINSNSGNLIVSGIELPASFFQQLVEKLQEQVEQVMPKPSPSTSQAPKTPEVEKMISPPISPIRKEKIKPGLKSPPENIYEETKSDREEIDEVQELKKALEEASLKEAELQRAIEEATTDDVIINEPNIAETIEEEALIEETVVLKPLEDDESGQKKTPFEERLECIEKNEVEKVVDPPQRPVRSKVQTTVQEEETVSQLISTAEEVPQPTSIFTPTSVPDTEVLSTQVYEEIQSPNEMPPPPVYEEIESSRKPNIHSQDSEEIPPPRPPQPTTDLGYLPSQPPASFYALRSPPVFKDLDIDDDIPMAPRRRRHHKAPVQTVSSSDELPLTSRRRHRTPEPSIPQLTGQLTRACVNAADRSLKRLIQHITNNILGNADGKQDMNVVVVILIVLIACLILLGWGDGKQIHHHHWEYFNPPRDI